MVIGCYVGDLDEGERFVRPLRSFGGPLLDLWKPKPFVAHQAMFDPASRTVGGIISGRVTSRS